MARRGTNKEQNNAGLGAGIVCGGDIEVRLARVKLFVYEQKCV
jgi:hypothetical protein